MMLKTSVSVYIRERKKEKKKEKKKTGEKKKKEKVRCVSFERDNMEYISKLKIYIKAFFADRKKKNDDIFIVVRNIIG